MSKGKSQEKSSFEPKTPETSPPHADASSGKVGASSGQVDARLAVYLDQLTVDQIRFIVARQGVKTHKEAALALDIPPDTVYQWINKGAPINETVKAMALDGLVVAAHVRRKHLAKAMLVKVAGLESEDEKIRQGCASEIIDWEMGRATQKTELTGAGGQDLTVELVWSDPLPEHNEVED